MIHRIFITILFVFLLITSVIASSTTVTLKTVRVGTYLRLLNIYVDKDGLHYVYFVDDPSENKAPECLGEEIFKEGRKVFDSYKEND